MKLKLFKASILFLILGLSLNSIGQNRYHVDETSFFEPGEYQEHLYDSLNDLYDWVDWQVAYRYLKVDGKRLNGIVFDTLNNGQIKYESHWKDGILDGVKKSWYENGQLEYENTYQKGAYHGLSRDWYENGQLESEYNYVNNDAEGLGRAWYRDGKPKMVSNFSMSYPIDSKEWYANGNLMLEKNTSLGIDKEWYENGQISSEEQWKNGKRNGVSREWFDNGQLKHEVRFKEGQRNGLSKYWYKNGQLRSEGNWNNWNRNGVFKTWYENGQLQSERHFAKDERNGIQKGWYENGNLKFEYNAKADGNESESLVNSLYDNSKTELGVVLSEKGNLDGMYREWHVDGKIKIELNFQKGKINKITCWDEDGNEIECE